MRIYGNRARHPPKTELEKIGKHKIGSNMLHSAKGSNMLHSAKGRSARAERQARRRVEFVSGGRKTILKPAASPSQDFKFPSVRLFDRLVNPARSSQFCRRCNAHLQNYYAPCRY